MSKLIYPAPGQIAVADVSEVIEASNKILSDAYNGKLKKHSERIYPFDHSPPTDYYYYEVDEADKYIKELRESFDRVLAKRDSKLHDLVKYVKELENKIQKIQKQRKEDFHNDVCLKSMGCQCKLWEKETE